MSNSKKEQLSNKFKTGDVIIFKENYDFDECDTSPNIKARINYIGSDISDVVKLVVNFAEFKEYNNKFWERNYWGPNDKANLIYPETEFYSDITTMYLSLDDILNNKVFSKVEESNDSNKELLDCIENLVRLYDIPLMKLKLKNEFQTEAVDIAKNILEKNGRKFQ